MRMSVPYEPFIEELLWYPAAVLGAANQNAFMGTVVASFEERILLVCFILQLRKVANADFSLVQAAQYIDPDVCVLERAPTPLELRQNFRPIERHWAYPSPTKQFNTTR